LKTTSLFFCQ